jgi:hypothetical protein
VVHPQNIAEAVAEELQKSTTGHQVRYVVSDYVSLSEVAKHLVMLWVNNFLG